jgi:uracil-DNA glycosylase family 4
VLTVKRAGGGRAVKRAGIGRAVKRATRPKFEKCRFSTVVTTAYTLDELAGEVRRCGACPLSTKRKNAVPGEGSARNGIVFVGEAPGAKEDAQGRPFVGSAGKLLTGLLKKNGLLREEVFITNTVKCRPPGNRPPKMQEMNACRPFLERQMHLLKPKLVCTLGNSPLHALVGAGLNISEVHGKFTEVGGIRYLPLYHPAAILYNRKLLVEMEKDFRLIGKIAREAPAGPVPPGGEKPLPKETPPLAGHIEEWAGER